jgi:hypothetical protein
VGARLFSNLKDAQLESPRTINGIGRLQDKRLFCSDRIFSPLSKPSASFESSESEADQHTSAAPSEGNSPPSIVPASPVQVTFGRLRSGLHFDPVLYGPSGQRA